MCKYPLVYPSKRAVLLLKFKLDVGKKIVLDVFSRKLMLTAIFRQNPNYYFIDVANKDMFHFIFLFIERLMHF